MGQVTSEIGRLREVVVHRPGRELRRLTPGNKEELLFDELVWVSKAQQEHDGFVEVLERHGVEVHRFADLLAAGLSDDEARRELVERLVHPGSCGIELVDRVRGHLAELPPGELATAMLGGLTVAEVAGAAEGFVGELLGPQAFLLLPLPNTVFTRDPSAWIGEGVLLAVMQRRARRIERLLWEFVYGAVDAVAPARVWNGEVVTPEPDAATLEGGDLLILSERCIAVGLSERTTPIAVENLAAELFAADRCDRVLAIDLPKGRGTMHLDTILTVVDRDAVLMWPRAPEQTNVYWITPGSPRMHVNAAPHLGRALADGLAVDDLRVLTTGEDWLAADREQWDDGNNTLALAPGVVVAYERNVDTNHRLEEAGIEVHRISSFELPRGRGGPRCMSCPVRRDPVG